MSPNAQEGGQKHSFTTHSPVALSSFLSDILRPYSSVGFETVSTHIVLRIPDRPLDKMCSSLSLSGPPLTVF